MTTATVYTWDAVPAESGNGAARREIAGAGASLKMITVAAGTVAARHSHTHEQFLQVLSGTGKLDCALGTVELRPGMVLHFAPDAWHSAVFETDTVLVEVNLNPAPKAEA
ncbi:cupin domain-containing protein [Azospirillum sp.]|uniref:cupin domain-containing protein n=1 Tax=Azospirillum sp. TaxID=34012 RepID=UPI003D70E06B